MKIVIAAWHVRNPNVGLGRYCRGLIEAIGRMDQENEYQVLMPALTPPFPAWPNVRYRLVRFPIFRRRFWEQVAPLFAGSYDILHFPHDSRIAWRRGRFITTIHDIKPLLFDTLRSGRNLNRAIERTLVGKSWSWVDHVVTDSHSSRRDILAHLGVPEDRLTVVYPGIDLQRFKPASRDESPRGRPYVLCVAGADPTKNVGTLVEAFASLPSALRESHELVLVGDFRRREDVRERVVQAGLGSRIVFTGVVNEERLIELYQQAALFVFPSLYEGFGLPVLEAMACGCPVICSNVSSLPEVAGDAAVLVDPDDVSSLSAAMEHVLADVEVWRELRNRGRIQAGRFSWDRTAHDTIAVYKRVGE